MFVIWRGIWFQIFGPQSEKARFPNWARVLTTTAPLVVNKIEYQGAKNQQMNM